jgi:hypothetical protein
MSNRWTITYLLLGIFIFMAQLASNPEGFANGEELINPTNTFILKNNFTFDNLILVQYMPFCGGCSVETSLFYPLTWFFEPSLLLWKSIPLLVWLGILLMSARITLHISNIFAVHCTMLLLLFSPLWYSKGILIGWGNHFESGLLVLICLWFYMKRRYALLGFSMGFSVWFCYGILCIFPVICLAYLLQPHRNLRYVILWGMGLMVGLLPWFWSRQIQFVQDLRTDEAFFEVYGQSIFQIWEKRSNTVHRLQELIGLTQWKSMWSPVLSSEKWMFGASTTFVFVVGILYSLCSRTYLIAFCAISYGLAYVFLSPTYVDSNCIQGECGILSFMEYRYLMPLYPLVAICTAKTMSVLWRYGGFSKMITSLLFLGSVGVGSGIHIVEFASFQPQQRMMYSSAVNFHYTMMNHAYLRFLDLEHPCSQLPPDTHAKELTLNTTGYNVAKQHFNGRGKRVKNLNCLDELSEIDKLAFLYGYAVFAREFIPSDPDLFPHQYPLVLLPSDDIFWAYHFDRLTKITLTDPPLSSSTNNLASEWNNGYRYIKMELRQSYPLEKIELDNFSIEFQQGVFEGVGEWFIGDPQSLTILLTKIQQTDASAFKKAWFLGSRRGYYRQHETFH